MGDDDAYIENVDHTFMTSCRCVSETAEVYEIKGDDFIRECKKQPCWYEIKNLIQLKRNKFAMRVVKKNEVEVAVGLTMSRKTKDLNLKEQVE